MLKQFIKFDHFCDNDWCSFKSFACEMWKYGFYIILLFWSSIEFWLFWPYPSVQNFSIHSREFKNNSISPIAHFHDIRNIITKMVTYFCVPESIPLTFGLLYGCVYRFSSCDVNTFFIQDSYSRRAFFLLFFSLLLLLLILFHSEHCYRFSMVFRVQNRTAVQKKTIHWCGAHTFYHIRINLVRIYFDLFLLILFFSQWKTDRKMDIFFYYYSKHKRNIKAKYSKFQWSACDIPFC